MTDLVVRRLLIDLGTPFPARWNGGDAFRSALFNALSMSFPVGEQFFIDSIRIAMKTLPESDQQRFGPEVQGFIGQEATHRRLHALFNAQLEHLGFDNQIARRALARQNKYADRNFRVHVAATAATEHFTAILAHWILRHPEVFAGAEPRLRTLWQWHSAEESEHRSTAFDVYTAVGGNHAWRVRIFKQITLIFLGDVMSQTFSNLRHDGALFQWRTWHSAAKLLFGKDGLVRGNYALWRDYLSPHFHPSQHEAGQSSRWLTDNSALFAEVGAVAANISHPRHKTLSPAA